MLEILIKKEYRGQGMGKKFFKFLEENYDVKRLRLEAEKDNQRAIKLYKELGFEELPYLQFIKER